MTKEDYFKAATLMHDIRLIQEVKEDPVFLVDDPDDCSRHPYSTIFEDDLKAFLEDEQKKLKDLFEKV